MRVLSVIIPVYNEVDTLESLIAKVQSVDLKDLAFDKEIIVVDDGSSDGSRSKLEKLQDNGIRVVLHERNRGKGAAVRTGIDNATGDFVVVQDADLEYDPREFRNLLAPVLDQDADVVFGSRLLTGSSHRVLYFWHSVGNRLLTLVSNMFTDLNLTDMETCYKLIRRDILGRIRLRENRFGFEPEITAKLARIKGIKIFEVGISYAGRTYEEGKKIGWKDGVRALYCILKYNLWARR